ncbi:hypothetical protein [Calothrix sp. 336/3]|uniref:hypothetical protein n=1 Tax=Calothrix sp. 336/3 TaxID=1337936 RepID=UPI0004E32CCA|nr:hypothetical protein [Calothrix sp. 336/3]AKG23768.1 hypothetical protein IJ00_22945 [Calothrix sp. 336/3]
MTNYITSFVTGEITLLTGITWLAIATLFSMLGGAIGGMLLAGEEFGYSFSAMIGSLFGPAGVVPAVIIGLIIISALS